MDTLQHTFSTKSYHCKQPRKLKLGKMEAAPSASTFAPEMILTPGAMVTPPQIAGIRRDYPLFSVLEGRDETSKDGSFGEDWVRLASQSESTTSVDGDKKAEDFEFL